MNTDRPPVAVRLDSLGDRTGGDRGAKAAPQRVRSPVVEGVDRELGRLADAGQTRPFDHADGVRRVGKILRLPVALTRRSVPPRATFRTAGAPADPQGGVPRVRAEHEPRLEVVTGQVDRIPHLAEPEALGCHVAAADEHEPVGDGQQVVEVGTAGPGASGWPPALTISSPNRS